MSDTSDSAMQRPGSLTEIEDFQVEFGGETIMVQFTVTAMDDSNRSIAMDNAREALLNEFGVDD